MRQGTLQVKKLSKMEWITREILKSLVREVVCLGEVRVLEMNEEFEDDLSFDSDQSEMNEEIEVEVAQVENAIEKLKKISTQLLYTEDKSRMEVLLDQLEECNENVEGMGQELDSS